jgi:hypothetical protein
MRTNLLGLRQEKMQVSNQLEREVPLSLNARNAELIAEVTMDDKKHVRKAASTNFRGSYSARVAFKASLTPCTLYSSIANTNFIFSGIEIRPLAVETASITHTPRSKKKELVQKIYVALHSCRLVLLGIHRHTCTNLQIENQPRSQFTYPLHESSLDPPHTMLSTHSEILFQSFLRQFNCPGACKSALLCNSTPQHANRNNAFPFRSREAFFPALPSVLGKSARSASFSSREVRSVSFRSR